MTVCLGHSARVVAICWLSVVDAFLATTVPPHRRRGAVQPEIGTDTTGDLTTDMVVRSVGIPRMGVQVKTLKAAPPGAPQPKAGDVIVAHYTGWLQTRLGGKGDMFDTSLGGLGPFKKRPFRFALGRNRVIKAWDIGIAKMRVGETARLSCSSDLCYGRDGAGPIPPDANLLFEVELLGIDGYQPSLFERQRRSREPKMTKGWGGRDELSAHFASEVRQRKLLGRAADIVTMSEDATAADRSPYAALLSGTAVGDAFALLLFSAASTPDGHALQTSTACFLLSWAALAAPLGAYADARSLAEHVRAPALAIACAVPFGIGLVGVLEGELPATSSSLASLAVAAALIVGWRALYFAVQKTDRAMNAFVLALVDEDEGDDDF